jgi:hypothetical protein
MFVLRMRMRSCIVLISDHFADLKHAGHHLQSNPVVSKLNTDHGDALCPCVSAAHANRQDIPTGHLPPSHSFVMWSPNNACYV